MRGIVTGVMTSEGGVGHTIPYLLADFLFATSVAIAVVMVELWAISYIRYRYLDTPFWMAAFQVVVGGVLVFLTGVLIGNA